LNGTLFSTNFFFWYNLAIFKLKNWLQHTGAYLIVDDLKNLQKSGRITGAQAWVGTLLKMKPVLKLLQYLILSFLMFEWHAF
jgi:hypothetical protein